MTKPSAPAVDMIGAIFRQAEANFRALLAARDREMLQASALQVAAQVQQDVVKELDTALRPMGLSFKLEAVEGQPLPRIHVSGPSSVERVTVTEHDAAGRIVEFVKATVPAACIVEDEAGDDAA